MKKRKTLKIIAAAVFLISLFCTVDLGLNLLYNAESGIHDGSYAVHSILHAVFRIFGDSPVSYTHLDVYKRQCHNSFIGIYRCFGNCRFSQREFEAHNHSVSRYLLDFAFLNG